MRLYWIRILALAQVALAARQHLEMLEPDERSRLGALAKQSRGRPWKNLSGNERGEMLRLVRKMEPGRFGRNAAMAAARGRKPKV